MLEGIQHETMLEAGLAVVKEQVEWHPPPPPRAFARASQNVAAAVALLYALSTPSTDGVGEVYQRLKSIVGTAVVQ
jgi:hypothetical protein